MALGEKLRQARLAAGLSQRQLCGEEITRNMLSQIENGSAQPSMSTLQYLASRLELPVSYFLDEEASVSGNATRMQEAWRHFESGNPAECYHLLDGYKGPDPIYDREYKMLKGLVLLELAHRNLVQNRIVYVRELLAQIEALEAELPWLHGLKSKRLEVAAAIGDIPEEDLPSLDAALLLHASAALTAGKTARAIRLLDAVDNREIPKWNLARGRAALAEEAYGTAAKYLQQAEAAYPKETVPLLEQCFREMGDYKMAYHYACKAR